MENDNFKIDATSYSIYIEDDFFNLVSILKSKNLVNKKVCIITDTNVKNLYLQEVYKALQAISFEVVTFSFKSEENNKNYNTVLKIYSFFLDNKLDRDSLVVALGGGIVGDVAGFAAATFMRGLKFIQVPTTLLAQIDSSVGGKVGINFENKKNIVGAFYNPTLVYINVSVLSTLHKQDFFAGLSEAIKHGLALNKSYYKYILDNKEEIKSLNKYVLKNVIHGSCKIKLEVVTKDEKEKGIRQILNFGHTFGHAIETLTNFEINHGYAVSIGMVFELYLSYLLDKISIQDLNSVLNIFKEFYLPYSVQYLKTEDIYNQMIFDKKVKNDILTFIVLNNIGTAHIKNDIDIKHIYEAINFVVGKK